MATSVTVSPQIVRAWFDTVLNPLIRALTTEATVLAHRNLTWKTEVLHLGLPGEVPVRQNGCFGGEGPDERVQHRVEPGTHDLWAYRDTRRHAYSIAERTRKENDSRCRGF